MWHPYHLCMRIYVSFAVGICARLDSVKNILKVVVLKHIITASISVNSNYAFIGSDGTVQHWYSGTVPKAVNTSFVFFVFFAFFCNTERKVLPKEAAWFLVEAVRCYHSKNALHFLASSMVLQRYFKLTTKTFFHKLQCILTSPAVVPV